MKKKSTINCSPSSYAKVKALMAAFLFVFAFAKAQNQLVLIPYSGSTVIPCGQNSLVQAHNGSTGTYSNNANGYVVINAGFAAAITINATYTTEASFDYIRIYNGVGTGGTLLGSYSGQNGTFTYAGSPGQTLTVQFTSDGSVVYAGFNLLVSFTGPCFATPCAGTPASNAVSGTPVNICPAMNTTLGLTTQYQLGGLQYQWYQSTVSNVGPFTPVSPNATLTGLVTSTLSTTTWYTAVITCTNSNQSYTTAAQQVLVMGSTTDVVPYNEGFEGVQINNMLPNCSWLAANLGNTARTSVGPQSNNRVANTGSNFGYFSLPSTNNTMYTNGIYMEPGITYSAGLFYSTEYFGYANWNDLSIAVGPNQNTTGQNTVASTAPAISGQYKELGGLFTVPSAGYYYLQISANGSSGNALYLMIDDISVTIPCTTLSGNSPTVSATASNTLICAGDMVSLNATGADAYLWNTGATLPNTTDLPTVTFTYNVIGTNTLTGCTASQTVAVIVNPSPTVSAVASMPAVCPTQISYLTALGASSYMWNNNMSGAVIAVTPNSTSSYTVIGTNQYGCSGSGVVAVSVLTPPTITAVNPLGQVSCAGEAITLSANGGTNYVWYSSSSSVLYSGSPISVVLTVPTTFTVVGTGSNGCSSKFTVNQTVDICGGIAENHGINSVQAYPNPTNDKIILNANVAIIDYVQLRDLRGRVVFAQDFKTSLAEINLGELSPGIYFAEVTVGGNSEIIRIVKQ